VKSGEFVGTFRRDLLLEPNSVTRKLEIFLGSVGENLYIHDEQFQKIRIRRLEVLVVEVAVVVEGNSSGSSIVSNMV